MPSNYASKGGAERAARRVLGAEALKGVHFYVCRAGEAYTWAALQPVEERRLSKAHKAELAKAQRGTMPKPPDFSAPTHAPYRKKLRELLALAKAGDRDGLQAVPINPISTSPRALELFRAMALVALDARERKGRPKPRAIPEVRASSPRL